jgi:uncharacterized membrane protein HdeD (DUF308 family)
MDLRERAKAKFRRRNMVLFRRWAFTGSGIILLMISPFIMLTPIPGAFLVPVVGLFLLARGSKTMRRLIKVWREAMPPVSRILNTVKNHVPIPVKRFIEKTDPKV